TWLLIERLHLGKSSALGAASGAVAGLATVTPAAGSVLPMQAMMLAAISSSVCYFFVMKKHAFGYDDSLDAFGIHGVSGIIGPLGVGIFASQGANSLLFSNLPAARDGLAQFLVQGKAILICGTYSFVITLALVFLIDRLMGFRLSPEDEEEGLDFSVHGEKAYNH
ncbi:MAG: ammonium transporter, partial [Gemmatimonadales bacterium]